VKLRIDRIGINEREGSGRNPNPHSAARFLLTSLSSEMVSLVPLPLGSDIQGLMPSPMTKMLVTLKHG
jgi:hypothetical protein